MSETIIRADNLSKRYRVGTRQRYGSLRETIAAAATKLLPTRRNRSGPGAHNGSDEFWALRNVSFEVRRGEVLGVIGRNGAGKSTLLKVLSRITQPTDGTVEINGRVGSLLEVGTGFHPELTGRENIFLNGAILGMSKSEIVRKFDEIVAFAEVDRFLDMPVKRYSSGMYTRLAFSVAAHLEPEILVVDEVLAVGDHAFQKKCIGKMGDVAHSGRTVLFVSHNLSQVSKLCTSALLLDRGTIRSRGQVSDVVNDYLANPDASGRRVDLTRFQNPHGAGELEVLALELLNGVGNDFAVPWDRPWELSVKLKANRRLPEFSVALGCMTLDSVPLFTVRSADAENFAISMDKGEVREVIVSIEQPLRAGFYNLVIGVASGNYAYYYHPAAAQLQVLEFGSTPYPDKNPGLINCRATWR